MLKRTHPSSPQPLSPPPSVSIQCRTRLSEKKNHQASPVLKNNISVGHLHYTANICRFCLCMQVLFCHCIVTLHGTVEI